ncbi:hypothetical protein SKAU_G00347820 [Synaphobranchus kaupii]|uniref:Uncharacterized protein n=1 Tax=Synaphobranchus kaupii TaxID=118154 RepID=A0A9Q1EJZ0_SYNKA|nr:hypothetical protein SKAU_G00347820 [Synaphobranchus kaupii]
MCLEWEHTLNLFLTTADSDATALAPVVFETWINKDGNFTKTSAEKTLDIFKIVGQSAFIDFDGDGKQDQLLPVCMDTACQRSAIYLSKAGDSERRRRGAEPSLFPRPGRLENPLCLRIVLRLSPAPRYPALRSALAPALPPSSSVRRSALPFFSLRDRSLTCPPPPPIGRPLPNWGRLCGDRGMQSGIISTNFLQNVVPSAVEVSRCIPGVLIFRARSPSPPKSRCQ